MMRRLPVYLVLDVSGSMSGEPIEAVRNGVQMLVSSLRQDPYALETAFLSVITFNDQAAQVVPLTELTSFQPPDLHAGGGTGLGSALDLLCQRIAAEVQTGSAEVKGDWKPVVFLMTDGEPTDSYKSAAASLKGSKSMGLVVGCGVGPGANLQVLREVTENVISLDTADSTSIKAFFKWVSGSIATSSKKIDSSKSDTSGLNELPPPPPEVNLVEW
jgi:uncharacterized protein YegL